MASIQQPLSPEALPSPLSSRPERSGAERSLCGCLFLEMFFDGAKPTCPGLPWRDHHSRSFLTKQAAYEAYANQ